MPGCGLAPWRSVDPSARPRSPRPMRPSLHPTHPRLRPRARLPCPNPLGRPARASTTYCRCRVPPGTARSVVRRDADPRAPDRSARRLGHPPPPRPGPPRNARWGEDLLHKPRPLSPARGPPQSDLLTGLLDQTPAFDLPSPIPSRTSTSTSPCPLVDAVPATQEDFDGVFTAIVELQLQGEFRGSRNDWGFIDHVQMRPPTN